MQASDRLYYTYQTLVDADQLLDSPEGSTSRERAAADLKVQFQRRLRRIFVDADTD